MRNASLFTGILLGLSVVASAAGPQRYAVIIGINDYADKSIPALKYAESDAKAVYETLIDPAIGNFPKENVKLLLGKDATNDPIKESLAALRGVDKEDLVVIFYSGHGAKSGDEAFWVTQQAKAKMLDATALPNSDINKLLAKIPSQRLVVLLDCCYAASTVKKSLENPAKLFGDFPGKGRATIAGAAENQEALEFPEKKSGIFTYYLVEGLRGAADSNADGVVTFEELWSYLGDNVRKASIRQGGLHEPVIITEGTTQQFLLTFNPRVRSSNEESLKVLRKLFDEQKITGAQFDLGRKALAEPAMDAAERDRRKAFSDLVAGKLPPEYLDKVLAEIKASTTPPPVSDSDARPTLAVVPFTVMGDLNVKDAGAILAERIMPLFAQKYQIVDQMQLTAFLAQDDLKITDVAEMATRPTAKGMSKAVRLRGVRLLVVGTVSAAPDGLTITARLCDWQTGRIDEVRVGQIAGEDWKALVGRLPVLAEKLTGTVLPEPPAAAATGKGLTLDLGNNVTMKLALIPAGKFMMGSPNEEKNRGGDESPQREVTLSRPFYMGVHAVTQEQYQQIMGKNPSSAKGPQRAVDNVTWQQAVDFCTKLSVKTGRNVRLPTEAQWEYACRAGSTTRFYFGDDLDNSKLGDYAWNDGKPQPVGQKKPNDWGLYDMHGNVFQWCSDWYGAYPAAGETDPAGPSSGKHRVLRGGRGMLFQGPCRSARRSEIHPGNDRDMVGFRVVVSSN